jgi:hypothetical protein
LLSPLRDEGALSCLKRAGTNKTNGFSTRIRIERQKTVIWKHFEAKKVKPKDAEQKWIFSPSLIDYLQSFKKILFPAFDKELFCGTILHNTEKFLYPM